MAGETLATESPRVSISGKSLISISVCTTGDRNNMAFPSTLGVIVTDCLLTFCLPAGRKSGPLLARILSSTLLIRIERTLASSCAAVANRRNKSLLPEKTPNSLADARWRAIAVPWSSSCCCNPTSCLLIKYTANTVAMAAAGTSATNNTLRLIPPIMTLLRLPIANCVRCLSSVEQ